MKKNKKQTLFNLDSEPKMVVQLIIFKYIGQWSHFHARGLCVCLQNQIKGLHTMTKAFLVMNLYKFIK